MDMHGYKSWKQKSHVLINFLPSLTFPQKSKQITQFSSQESFREPSTSNKKHILKKYIYNKLSFPQYKIHKVT